MRVAIAGYGDLARYICEEFTPLGHAIVILSRRPYLLSCTDNTPDSTIGQTKNIGIITTDYTPSSLHSALEECDVLISTISDTSPGYTSVHLNMLEACRVSARCKRFIPAEFAADIERFPDQPGFYYGPHEPVRDALRNQNQSHSSNSSSSQSDPDSNSYVEWTLVCIGWLADYFVPRQNRYIRDIGPLQHPLSCFWTNTDANTNKNPNTNTNTDAETEAETDSKKKIVIPGTGDEPVDFTWARDVAQGLAALVVAPRGSWLPYTFMSGERSSWNEAIKLVLLQLKKQKQNNFGQRDVFPAVEQHISLHSVAEMIKKAAAAATDDDDRDRDEQLVLADYYLLSISHACAAPPERVEDCRKRFFANVRFRTLRDGFLQLEDHPEIIL